MSELNFPRLSGTENMERDVALLDQSGWVCRVYGWNGPWVTLGRNQIRSDLLPDCRIPWVSRPTGGKAVLHGHDITVGLKMDVLPHSKKLKQIYRTMCEPLIAALNDCGVEVALGEERLALIKRTSSTDCFFDASPNDIVHLATGQKVCGCAFRLYETAALLQASIPVERPLVDPAEVFAVPAPVSWVCLEPELFMTRLHERVSQTIQTGQCRSGSGRGL